MLVKQKLTLASEDEIRERNKKRIVGFVEDRFMKGMETTQKDILDVFKERPYQMSQGTIVNYLSFLVDERSLSTSYKNGHRYYALPHLPLSIKFGMASSTAVITLCTLANIFLSKEDIYRIVSFGEEMPNDISISVSLFPVMFFLLVGFIVTSIVWYVSDGKKGI